MLVEKVIGRFEDFKGENLRAETIRLDSEEMAKPHQKLKTKTGETVAVSLPRGDHLFDGAVLYKDAERLIAVELIPEDALKICPCGNAEWAKAAFNIGNMHHAAYFREDAIITARDSVLEGLLDKLGLHYEVCHTKLAGEKLGIVVGHDHHHHHG